MSNQEGEWNQKYSFCIACMADILQFSGPIECQFFPLTFFSLQMIIVPIVPRHRINGPCWKLKVYTVEIFMEDYL